MTAIKAVIGANYGDEGKGFAVDYLCGQALKDRKSCLVICSNGGGQRGHTVETPEGDRFVFHHLGSGSLLGVGSYFCSDFILNPVVFHRDWNEFLERTEDKADFRLPPLYADRECRFSTPFDMMTNQILEDARGENRHGSVGIGIWETVRRYEKGLGITAGRFAEMDAETSMEYLKKVRDYASLRIREKTGQKPEDMEAWKDIWTNEQLLINFRNDFDGMLDRMGFLSVQDLKGYDILIIENAQGVLLGQSRYNGQNFTTPSDTGAREIRRLLDMGMREFVEKTELYYVTRTYLTKHGAGYFEGECSSEEICPGMYDRTNIPNGYQGTIRYGRLNPEQLMSRIREDLQDMGEDPCETSLLITHANEAAAEPICKAARAHVRLLISDGHSRESVRIG